MNSLARVISVLRALVDTREQAIALVRLALATAHTAPTLIGPLRLIVSVVTALRRTDTSAVRASICDRDDRG
jgi:hypothetical protein